MEVETPALASHGVTDVYLKNLSTAFKPPGATVDRTLYLQTSPEYHMKRLLACGSGDIFQIAKAFRDDELGRMHNPEFTLLEWYRLGFDHHQLMDEVNGLLKLVLACRDANKISYQALFKQELNIDPMIASCQQLKACAQSQGFDIGVADRDQWLALLMSHCIEPVIGQEKPVFVYDFPASQASLAKCRQTSQGHELAERFEVYFKGVELANGFNELTCPIEQKERFSQDNAKRKLAGTDELSPDPYLLASLEAGLPPCAGVALGIDRLVMLALSRTMLSDVMSFSLENA